MPTDNGIEWVPLCGSVLNFVSPVSLSVFNWLTTLLQEEIVPARSQQISIHEGKFGMQWNGIKIPIVILALVVGLASFLGVQWIYNRYNYERPLTQLLGANKQVVTYQINDNGPQLEVQVKLGKVDNLQTEYSELYQSLQGIVGKKDFKIVLQDQRDETLNDIYYRTRLASFEALDRGNFLEMEAYISKLAASEGAQAWVWIDQDRLYIQLNHGNNYLYEIIPRTKKTGVLGSGELERGNPS